MMQITILLDDSALSLGAILRLRKNLFAAKAAVRIKEAKQDLKELILIITFTTINKYIFHIQSARGKVK